MPTVRRVALMADLEGLTPHQRETLRGIRRFAEANAHWRIFVDPFAATEPTAPRDGIVLLTGARAAANAPPPDIPVVAVTHDSWHLRTLSRVVPNLRTAGRRMAEHLVQRSFLGVGCLGTCPDQPARLMREGFMQRCRRAGLNIATLLFHPRSMTRPRGWPVIRAAIARWLDRDVKPPTGVMVSSVPLARLFADVCLAQGLGIPDDVAIIAPGGDPDLTEFPPPALTTLDLGYEACGFRAAALLDERMAEGSTVPRRTMLPPGAITARRSTDIVTWLDPLVQRACRHIADHCAEPLRVGDVAAALGVSLRELQRRVKRIHPRTLVGEVAHARIQRAKRLLRTSDMAVAQVARRAGFGDARTFARLFRAAEGHSPTAYRRLRPREPDPDAPDLEKAKRLMATTRLSLETIAHDCGFRHHRYLIDAFHVHEGVTPRAWRKEHRERRPPTRGYGPVIITFIGPDGKPEPWQAEGEEDR